MVIKVDEMPAKIIFTKELLKWNKLKNKRAMPWKNEKDPYKIWISEIILQQTRVNQGLEYYNRFIARFPEVKSIALAKESEVFKMWEGLGYYSRCKNIIVSAKYIYNDLGGKFPDEFENILNLKGVGTYTASAIASFAYNLPFAVVDGNVYRVLSRYFAQKIPVDTGKGKQFYNILANELLDKNSPGVYNQSIMDFGATICKPLPLCEICPFNLNCEGCLKGIHLQLPVKEKSIIKKNRWLYYLQIKYRNKFYIKKREEKDIWQNLYEFVLLENSHPLTIKKLLKIEEFQAIFHENEYKIEGISEVIKQQLTHQSINAQFISISVKSPLPIPYQLVTPEEMKNLPFPKIINTYLKD